MTDRHEIVLLPGLDGTGELFEWIKPRLDQRARVTVIRYPYDARLDYADYARIVRDEVADRPVILLGESFSGPVAVMAALGSPRNVKGLVLAATFLKSPWPPWLVRLSAGVNPMTALPFLRRAILTGGRGGAALDQRVSAVIRELPSEVRAARLRAVSAVDVRRQFSNLACPSLVLLGRDDWLVPKSPLELAARHRPNTKVVVLPCAHLLLQIEAEAAARHILAFLEAL